MKKLVLFFHCLAVMLISGCVTTGAKFDNSVKVDSDKSALYLMRQSKFVGALICRPVIIDEVEKGCLTNGGFLRVDLEPGEHVITMPKVNRSDWFKELKVNGTFNPGKIYYLEWTGELVNLNVLPMGALTNVEGETQSMLIEHTESGALSILKGLRNSN